jgi:hypothetical protein
MTAQDARMPLSEMPSTIRRFARMTKWYVACSAKDNFFLDIASKTANRPISNGDKVIISDFQASMHRVWEIDNSDNSFLSAGTSMSVDIGSRGGVKAGNDIIMWRVKTGNLGNQT